MTSLDGHDDAPKRTELPNGNELHYVEKGRGQAVILLHGGMGDCHSWAPQIEAISARCRVVAYSRRGSSPNRNPPPATGHSIDIEVDDLLAFKRILRIGPAHLVGTSYGALVALAFALEHPAQVLSLVLTEPPLHRWACSTPAGAGLYAAFMADVWQPAAAAFATGEEDQALRLLADGMWGRPVFDALPPRRLEAIRRNTASMKALARSRDPFPDLDRTALAVLAIRTLLVHGAHASALHRCVIDELALALPHAVRAVIADAGHGVPQENPKGFNDAVVAFLAACRTL